MNLFLRKGWSTDAGVSTLLISHSEGDFNRGTHAFLILNLTLVHCSSYITKVT